MGSEVATMQQDGSKLLVQAMQEANAAKSLEYLPFVKDCVIYLLTLARY